MRASNTITALVLAMLGAWACDGSPANDRARAMREGRLIEAANTIPLPQLPLRKQVGCDVCPFVCKYMDLSLIPMEQVVREFRHLALEWDRTQSRGFPPTNYDYRMERLGCIADRHGVVGAYKFSDLLFDDHDAVRYMAAIYALDQGLANAEPARVLRELLEDKSPYSMYASVRLRLWEKQGRGEIPMSDEVRKLRFRRP
jgi:hypothetical protein